LTLQDAAQCWRCQSSGSSVGPSVGILLDAHGHYNVFVDHPLDFRGDQLFLSDRPGLGVDLDVELLEAKSAYHRPGT
jgi:L-alanine-DL-glutamate epimerase-like enolase superfamily enzyme